MYCSLNIVRVIKFRIMRWAGHVACMVERRGVYRVLVGKSEGKRTLVRSRIRREDNIKMDHQEVGWGYLVHMGEGRGVNRVLVGKPEGKRPLGRPRSRWEDNIKMDLQEVGRGGVWNWIKLAEFRDR